MRNGARWTALPAIALSLAACGTLENGRGWGRDATLAPGWARVRSAAASAALSPHTWVPALGAVVFASTRLDREVSDWASEHRPVFGTHQNADRKSNALTGLSLAGGLTTALATPSGSTAGDVAGAKSRGMAVEGGALLLTLGATNGLKHLVGRTRPDGRDDLSFPSAHAAGAFASASLGRANLAAIPMSDAARLASDLALTGLAAGAAWARVEAQKHYPSDVLASAALANLLCSFTTNAFLGLGLQETYSAKALPRTGGALLVLTRRW